MILEKLKKTLIKKISSKKDQKGVALLLALFCVVLISFIAVEISFDTSVEYILSSKEYYREKAYAAARAGVELSLLRIQLFKNVTTTYAQQLGSQQAITQLIWSYPFMWPPTVTDAASIADKDQIGESVKNSLMDAQYITTISSEGAKLDINDLASPSQSLRTATYQALLQIFENKRQSDEKWAETHRNFNAQELINNITDWITPGDASLNGGDKQSRYPQFRSTSGDGSDKVPPERPFQTLDELRMVAGMTDEYFQLLLPNITVYGIKGINVNKADGNLLRAIDPLLNNDDILKRVLERRDDPNKGGPFRDVNDLIGFIGANQNTFNPTKIPLYFGNEFNFRIHSTGVYSNVTREIIAVVYDVSAVENQLKSILDADASAANGTQQPPPGTPATAPAPAPGAQPNQKPRIVYWWEN